MLAENFKYQYYDSSVGFIYDYNVNQYLTALSDSRLLVFKFAFYMVIFVFFCYLFFLVFYLVKRYIL